MHVQLGKNINDLWMVYSCLEGHFVHLYLVSDVGALDQPIGFHSGDVVKLWVNTYHVGSTCIQECFKMFWD